MSSDQTSRQANAPQSTTAPWAPGQSPAYQVAALPPQEVAKLQRIEKELADDTGHEIVVVAYEKQKRS